MVWWQNRFIVLYASQLPFGILPPFPAGYPHHPEDIARRIERFSYFEKGNSEAPAKDYCPRVMV